MKIKIIHQIIILIAIPAIYCLLGPALKFYSSNVSVLQSKQNGKEPISLPDFKNNKDFTNSIFYEEYGMFADRRPLFPWNNLTLISDSLHFNAINWYNFWGDDVFGRRASLLNDEQIYTYDTVLQQISARHLKGFIEKCNFSYPMYGQRLVYEITPPPGNNSVNYGFCYNTTRGGYTTDNGRTVLHEVPDKNDTGYICKDIYENFQHSDLFDFRQNDKGKWYIEPVMRIPPGLPDGLTVVTIDVVSFDGNIIKSIPIKTENFKNGKGTYSGEYTNNYSISSDQLVVLGDESPGHLNQGRKDEYWNWDNSGSPACCHVDFRVRWHGKVEVWLEKIIVDDEIARRLFDPDRNNNFDKYIEQQAREFTNQPGYYSFFTDEICISQVPCLKYVIGKMSSTLQGTGAALPKFSIALSNYLHVRGLKNDNLSYKYVFDSLSIEHIQMDSHMFYINPNGTGAPIPDVFPQHDPRFPSNWFTSTTNYNNILQNHIFGDKNSAGPDHLEGSFIYQVNRIRNDSRQYSPQTQLIIQPEIQGEMSSEKEFNSPYIAGLREPTNEEIQADAMLAIAHGAEGLCWYVYHSLRYDNKTSFNNLFGLINPPDMGYTQRTQNLYFQDKWHYVSQMNKKILIWKPILDNLTWLNGYSVHSEGANHYYIKEIKSIFEYENNTIPDDINYWEIGFFQSNEPDSKYFIMVNRRCIPATSKYPGDTRHLKIKFDPEQFGNHNNWKLIDLNTNNSVLFNKNSQGADGFVELGNSSSALGYYNPGEGKLYELIPND